MPPKIELIFGDYAEKMPPERAFDVAIYDPPFDKWSKVKILAAAKIHVAFTNFQNRHHVGQLFGVPRFEIIWFFKDGRWVSHNMPRLTHEHILIYGALSRPAYVGENIADQRPRKKGTTSIGRDKSFAKGARIYTPRARKMLNSVLEYPRTYRGQLGAWGKPRGLILNLIEWLVPEDGTVWDGFAGSGVVADVCRETGRGYYGTENNRETYNKTLERMKKGGL